MNVMIIPEMHLWDKPFKTIPTYVEDMQETLKQIRSIAVELSQEGPLVIIHMGDIFHKSITNYDYGMDCYDYFCSLEDIADQYTLLGNHEITYSRKNPFWRFVDVKSRFVKSIGKFKMYEDVLRHPIKLVDSLRIGGTEIIFWHYGMDISEYKTDASDVIIVAHQTLMDKEISDVLNHKYSRDQLEDIIEYRSLRAYSSLPKLQQLRYVFVGHMHSAYSRFVISENMNNVNYNFVLQYLGSLGRTKAIEVRDDDRVRTIPVFQMDERGSFVTRDHKITLPGEECIFKRQVAINREAYRRQVENRELKQTAHVIKSPMITLQEESEKLPWLSLLVDAADKSEPVPQLDELIALIEKPLPKI